MRYRGGVGRREFRATGTCTTHRWRRIVALVIGVPLAATGLTVIAAPPARAATRSFSTPIFTANTTGDVMVRGNSMETCPAGSDSAGSTTLTCAAVQAGTNNGYNNNFNMGYVDVDTANPPTGTTIFDSSSATITVPAGATVLYAGLSWSATALAGSLTGYPALTGVAAPGCSTTIAAGSNGLTLPRGTINVASTAGFPSSGAISVTTSAGVKSVTYSGLTSTTFTGGAGGSGTMSTGGAVTANCDAAVDFKTPAGSSYTTVTSSQNDSTGGTYQGYANETSALLAGGSGTYTVGNVQAGTGGNEYAGWALAIAYRDPTQPIRNLDVYTGFTSVANGATTSIGISGFETPLTGSVVTRLGAVVYEGDRGLTGDTLTLGNNAISNSLNPVNDVENSSVSDLGVAITNRNPSYANTLGVDVDRFDATGFLANGQTSTTINLKTVGDGYYPSIVTLATNLYSPSLQTTKTVMDVTSGTTSAVKAGDVLTYSMAVDNIGGDASNSSVLTDATPAGATYVPGSLVIGGTPVVDAGNVTGGTVTARLGTGATASAGGSMAVGATTTVAFEVVVNTADTSGTLITNAANLTYTGATTGTALVGSSNTVSSTVNSINVNPVLASAAPPSGEVSVAYTDTFSATGGTGPYTYAVSTGAGNALPAGITLNPSTGVVSGTPTASGFYNFTLSATDANGQVATEATSIYVAPAPVLAFPVPQAADSNSAYSFPLGVNPGTGPYVWSVSAGSLPAGLSLDPPSGLLSGTPTGSSGTSSFTVKVVDDYGPSATEATSLTVTSVPTLTYAPPPAGDVGVPYSDTLTESGGTQPYIWSTTGTLPAGLTLDSSTGLLSGTPTMAGTYTFPVVVTDANNAASTAVSTIVTVDAAPALSFTPPSGEVGVAYAATTLAATSGTGPYTYAVTSGSLPSGVTLSAAGVWSGTPTTAGTSSFTVTATDAAGGVASDPVSIPVVVDPTLGFATPPVGVIHTAYTDALTEAGGTGPFTWSVSAGALPGGITLASGTGVLSGTPTVAGTFNFTVRLVDHDGQSVTQPAALVIDPVAALVASVTTVPFGTAVTFTANLTASAATGSVTFTDLLSGGPQSGQTVTLGTVTLAGGTTQLTMALPAFDTNTVTASYGGDGTYPAASSPTVAVQVDGYQGEVIVDELRLSGPNGANDSYVELYNSGPPVPMAGFTVTASSGASVTLPSSAPTLPTGHAYLVTGGSYSLASVAASDDMATSLGSAGVRVTAPDSGSTVVDAVGSSGAASGFFSGTALPALSGSPTDQYAWVRLESAGLPVDTDSNAADFKLVSTTGGVVGGVQSTLGSPAPRATGSPNQNNSVLESSLLNTSDTQRAAPNFVYLKGVLGHPGLLTVRRTVTNTSGSTVTSAVVRITSMSEANGAPLPGRGTQPGTPADVRLVGPATATTPILVGLHDVTVQNLSPDAPSAASPGGGLNTTLEIPLPGGGLASNASVSIAFTFDVDSGGTYWFGYDIDALGGSLPDLAATPVALEHMGDRARTALLARPTLHLPAYRNGGRGRLP